MSSYEYRHYPYVRPSELDRPRARWWVVILLGAGIAGPTLALSLATRGRARKELKLYDTVPPRQPLDLPGQAQPRDLGPVRHRGAHGREGHHLEQGEVYLLDTVQYRLYLQPDTGHKFSVFVPLQQYYVEDDLLQRCRVEARIQAAPSQQGGRLRPRATYGVTLTVETPDGTYTLETDWLVACDGVPSPGAAHAGIALSGRDLP